MWFNATAGISVDSYHSFFLRELGGLVQISIAEVTCVSHLSLYVDPFGQVPLPSNCGPGGLRVVAISAISTALAGPCSVAFLHVRGFIDILWTAQTVYIQERADRDFS